VRDAAPAITVKVRASRKEAEALRLRVERLAARLGVPAASVSVRKAKAR
jgi:hypothetical protein